MKKKIIVDEGLIRNIIRSEIQGPGQLAGYRKIWHILRIKHHVHAPRRLVAQIFHELDPDAMVVKYGRQTNCIVGYIMTSFMRF